MALVYEKCWNENVSGLAPWKRKIITDNFEIVDGHMTYPNRRDRDIANEAAHQAAKDADAIIHEMYTGKY